MFSSEFDCKNKDTEVIEKLLKAVYIQNIGEIVPKTRDLYKLAIDVGAKNVQKNIRIPSLILLRSCDYA